MHTNKRLKKACENATIIPFDENSKFIIFSDLHRGDDSMSDEFSRNQSLFVNALSYYYKRGYTYIEAGDGDELWEHPHFKHIRSAHTDVLTEMRKFHKEHRFYMMYGNHNIFLQNPSYVEQNYYHFDDEYRDKRVELFPDLIAYEALKLRQSKTGQEILIVHGHQGDLLNDQLWYINFLLTRYVWRFIHLVGFKNPSSPARSQYKRHKVEKNYSNWIKQNKMMLICGHTHRMRFPKKGQIPYFNSGCCIHSKGITGIEIINNEIMTVQWRVQGDENGVVRMKRNVIRGPEAIENFRI